MPAVDDETFLPSSNDDDDEKLSLSFKLDNKEFQVFNQLPDVAGFKKVKFKYQKEKYVCTKNNQFANFNWKWKR